MEENKKNDEKSEILQEEKGLNSISEENKKPDYTEETKEEGRYKTLMHLENNLWTYGSPIIFQSGVLQRDLVNKKNRLSLKFTNIYHETIKNVSITIFVSDEDGNAEQIEHEYIALGQKYLASKGASAGITIKNEDARKFVIRVDSVIFEDGSMWEKEDAIYESVGELEDIESFAEAKAKDYEDNYTSGTDAVSKDDSASIANGIEILKRIKWYKNTAEILKDAKRKYKIAIRNEERKKESEDRRLKRQQAVKKRYLTVGITIVIIALLTGLSIVAFFIPNGKYKDAKKLLNKGEYEKAEKAFTKLNGFLKSEGYLAQIYYSMGLKALENGDEKTASDYFKKGYDADKESDYGLMAGAFLDYYAGEEALEQKDYEKAEKLFKSSANAASDFNLINKSSAGMAQISYLQKKYDVAWNTIKNVYTKDQSYEAQYGTYGYAYAKSLVDAGKTQEGMEIYNKVSQFTKETNLNESVYNQAVKLGEQGKIDESMKLLSAIKKGYGKADKLYKEMEKFNEKVQYWVGLWKHHGTVNGEKKTYRITISKVLYKGEMCLKIKDLNNAYLGFETVISSQNRVTQILIGSYQLHFKLKKFHDQKFTYTLKEGNKMVREQKYDGKTYKATYKKKVK